MRQKIKEKVEQYHPGTVVKWMILYQLFSVVFLLSSLLSLCLGIDEACKGDFFTASLNVTVFGSDYFEVTPGQYAGLCIMFFFAGVGYVIGFVLIDLAYSRIYAHPRGIPSIFRISPAVLSEFGARLLIYLQFLFAILLSLIYSVFFFLGALGQWPFALCMGGGSFAAFAFGGARLIMFEDRVIDDLESGRFTTSQ